MRKNIDIFADILIGSCIEICIYVIKKSLIYGSDYEASDFFCYPACGVSSSGTEQLKNR
jgi:hypothetical protein